MTRMYAHVTYDDYEDDEKRKVALAWVHPASQESVDLVLSADENDPNGRSQWMWLRLPNGDLILGIFPQGDTYMGLDEDSSYPQPSELEVLMDKKLGAAANILDDNNIVRG